MEAKVILEQDSSIVKVGFLRSKLTDYNQLVKFRLTFLVVFSSVITYLTASHGAINWFEVVMLSLGGFLVTGSANGINQAIRATHRQNFLIPPRARRSFPLVELLPEVRRQFLPLVKLAR